MSANSRRTPPRPRSGPAVAATIALFATATLAPTAAAESDLQLSKYGIRLGLSSEPDQLTVGAYAGYGELAPALQLRPSVDLGFGDRVFTVLLNADLQYFFSITEITTRPYFGGGLGMAYYDFDSDHYAGDDTRTEIGINLYVGAEKDLSDYKTAHLEFRVGVDELPDFKVTLGLGFY